MHQEHSAEEVQKHVRTYLVVFVMLLALTFVTVAISRLHLGVFQSIVLALIIACIKGSLVALFFMHLISEKKLIYGALALTVAFFIGLMFLPVGQMITAVAL